MQPQGSKSVASAATAAVKQTNKPGRRPRVPLSCDPCRSRKLKCNREQPCQNCTARAEQTTCKFRGSRNGPGPGASPPERERADTMQQRIDRLESLVKTLMTQGQRLTPPQERDLPNRAARSPDDLQHVTDFELNAGMKDSSALPYSAGTTVINGEHSVYKAGNGWADVLQEVNELKQVWNQTQDDPPDYDMQRTIFNMVDGSSFLSGSLKKVDVSELLAALPSKSEVDKLVSQFFDRRHLAMPIAPVLHKPTFMREYEEHWKDPTLTNIMWIGLLFSILGITMLSYHQSDTEPPEYTGRAETLFSQYRLRTAQCLMIGDIAKCLPYTLETLLLNSTAELARKDDNARGLWMMTGVMIRTAINMGYHREPSQTSSISTLQGELRRRVWLALVHKDDLASFLVGFPSMMPEIYSDTLEPRNLHDWELASDTSVLPPSRPLDESTPVTYLISKGRLMRALGRVTDFNNSLRPGSYDRLLEVDRFLYESFENLPFHMKLALGDPEPDSEQSQTATDTAILQMEFLYHLGMCSLHRKFLSRGRLDTQYSLSRDRCISSALAILEQQRAFHYEAKVRAPFLIQSWYEVSRAREMFILAAMILCLDLEHRRRGARTMDMVPESAVLLHALERACAIWKDVQGSSDEAWRMWNVLTGMLSSFEVSTGDNSSQNQASESTFELLELYQRVQNTDSTPSTEEHLLETSNEMDIDWATWDSFIDGASFEDAYEGMLFNDNDLSFPTE